MEMEMEIDEEEAKQKQKRMEGGDSPDPKRTKAVDKIKGEEDDDSVSEMSEDSDVEVEEEEKEWVRPPLTVEELEKKKKQEEEHKVWKAERSKRLIEYYGTDDSEAIYWIIEEKRAAYDALCALEHHDEEEEEEPELDENEIQRVNNILNDVEDRTRPISHTPRTQDHLVLPQVDFFLLAPWVDADCTRKNQNGKARTLSMYYKRLFPAVESACGMAGPYSWNRLPEVDAEYLSLYSKFCDLVEEDHKSWFLHLKSPLTRRSDYRAKAREMAKQLNLQTLKERDISECLQNVFKEGDTIAEHKLKEEYDMHLLACEFEPKLRRADFTPKEPTPIINSMVCFNAVHQRSKFDMWMEEKKALNLTKDQCREELVALHAKNLRQYCGTRIRFIKYKRAWAKNLGIISE